MKQYIYQVATDQKQGVLAFLVGVMLKLLSYIFFFLSSIRFLGYQKGLLKSNSLGKPVISIGNLTLGGVGKTPIVEQIARHLKDKKFKVVILTRGYKGGTQGDEVKMLEENLENVVVLAGANRYHRAVTYLEKNDVDVFILDDGFQHLKLERDLDVVAIDAMDPWGNGSLLPRGILREAISSIKRADVVLITKSDLGERNLNNIKSKLHEVGCQVPVVLSTHSPQCYLDVKTQASYELGHFQSDKVCLISSIGRPEAFEATLKGEVGRVEKSFRFMDHYDYAESDIRTILNFCKDHDIQTIITTQKDAVKLKRWSSLFSEGIRCVYLKINISFLEGKDFLFERVDSLLLR